jgi:signal transduction histidine kinase
MVFDSEALHRAILNVVTNAVDACEGREQAQVTVITHYGPDEQTLRVSVEDTGEGIAPEDIKRIFNIFESKKGRRGTGLGLPVSQKILHEHSGDITVTSTPGQGSCFVLEWPCVSPGMELQEERSTGVIPSTPPRTEP